MSEFGSPLGYRMFTIPDSPPVLEIYFGSKSLLRLKVVDDVLTAAYEPHDLDTAARVFVDYINGLFGKPKTLIGTVDELDALPDGSIVRDADGEAWKRDGSCEIGEAWFKAGGECDYPADRVPLPALVLWTPEAVTGE